MPRAAPAMADGQAVGAGHLPDDLFVDLASEAGAPASRHQAWGGATPHLARSLEPSRNSRYKHPLEQGLEV